VRDYMKESASKQRNSIEFPLHPTTDGNVEPRDLGSGKWVVVGSEAIPIGGFGHFGGGGDWAGVR